MQLAAFLNVNYEGDDLLPVMLVVFNLVPVSIFLAVMSFTIVVNFGVALLVQCEHPPSSRFYLGYFWRWRLDQF